jgi:CDP-glycerol glycerophosphotransferase (TagB/SpsB family)
MNLPSPQAQRGVDPADTDPLVPYLIDEAGAAIINDAARIDRECRLLAGSDLFDAAFYADTNPDVVRAGLDPLRHFCEYGWRDLRAPSKDFDVWWYWASHLDPSREAINPLVHYALVGRQAGLDTRPGPYRPREAGYAFAADRPVRRACLFAGYDPDGVLDDCTVDYLRELSRHADVWYMADGEMQPGELGKLDGVTRGAWAFRHGAYDFGSWSKLARDLVGWDTLERYDEVLLVNDSCYLLHDLDEVFARMDAKACDWWALQATKGLAATRHRPSNRFHDAIPMEEVERAYLPQYEAEYPYDFHLGAYFLALRKPVIEDQGFRRRLDGVVAETRARGAKRNIIAKYEIGIGRYLMASGHPFESFIDRLYPFHPVYSESAFSLIAAGFPLLKRYLLAQNHYHVTGLVDWKERVQALVPGAPIDRIERNLLRVSDYEKLYRNLRYSRGQAGHAVQPPLLAGAAFARADAATPTYDHWWAFPVCAFTHRLAGNARALFEEVKGDPSIKKIVLARSRHVEVDGENVVMVPLRSEEGQYHLMRSRQIFIKHSPTRNIEFPVSPHLHNIINLWHGIPLKRIGYASLDMQDKLEALAREHRQCRAVISSSRIDTLAMAAAFHPLSYNDIWCTGLPRNDFILREFERLPADLREEHARAGERLAGRRLVLFVPTFRAAQEDAYFRFAEDEVRALHAWLRENGAVLGVREHMADTSRMYYDQLRGPDVIDLGDWAFPDIEMLYRHAAALITDYSSSFIDFLLTGRPVVSFAYDYESYSGNQRGLFYDMQQVFPGPICCDFASLMRSLEDVLRDRDELTTAEYRWKRRLFFDHFDDANAWRVAQRVKGLYAAPESPAVLAAGPT